MARSNSTPVIVYRGRTTTVMVDLGVDVSGDDLTSEIRTGPDVTSTIIAEWDVNFVTDGADGMLILTLDDADTSEIEHTNGYMDIKRVSNGEPIPVFKHPIPVTIVGVVTE